MPPHTPLSSSSATTAVDSVPASSDTTAAAATTTTSHAQQDSPTQTPNTTDLSGAAPHDPNNPSQSALKVPEPEPAPMDDAATTEAARSALMAHLSNVGSASLAPLSQRAADINAAHSSIAKQREGVDASAAKLGKESAKLSKEAEKADDVLKDLGNVENWAQVLDRDISVLEETLRIVEADGYDPELEREGAADAEAFEGVGADAKKGGKGRESWLWGLWPGGKGGS